MSFLYFAYGSNLWPPRLRSRCPSTQVVTTARLKGWSLHWDKPSVDGSAKLNIRPEANASVTGALYEIEDGERQALDEAEPLYSPIVVEVDGGRALTYTYEGSATEELPYDWYLALVEAGARHHGLDPSVYQTGTKPDPLAPGVRPADHADLPTLQAILSAGLAAGDGRYSIHPGDLAWWVYHDDPRHPDHFSMWVQGTDAFVVVDSLDPGENCVFARPGVDRMALLKWAQKRLQAVPEAGWVADTDHEMVTALKAEGYEPVDAFRHYEWDLTGDLPRATSPEGWELRAVRGEEEANARRAAAHAAFESTMDPAMHLDRYLGLMRSPAYVRERDLVAVDREGTVGSFMIWWADGTGIAQIEPFGTDPRFHRQGMGRALIYHGLAEMKAAGMRVVRVCTEDDRRPATDFYVACGFTDVGRLRWWRRPVTASPLQDA
jgi:ribosomal protein S18 acetylase RimI-like enzyme